MVRLAKGEDIREVGSRNVGAVNTFQQAGAWAGLTVLLLDTAKGALAVTVPRLMGVDDWTMFVPPPLVIAGHNWPRFRVFRGGQGAAASFVPSLVAVLWLSRVLAPPPRP